MPPLATVDRTLERLTRIAIALCVTAAVVVVAAEWLVRQALDTNLFFDWLEVATVAGGVAAAFALPLLRADSPPPAALGPWRVMAGAWTLVALCVAAALIVFLLTGRPDEGRSHFFPVVSLLLPFAAIAICAVVWSLRCAVATIARAAAPSTARGAGDLAASMILIASLLVIFAGGGDYASTASLVSQTLWGVIGQDDFLTLLLASVLVETLCATFERRPDARESTRTAGLVAGLAGDLRSPGGSLPNGRTALESLGCMMPIGSVPLALAVLIGLSTSEAVAAIVLPCALCATLWVLHRLYTRRGTVAALHAWPLGAARSLRESFDAVSLEGALAAVTVPICAVVVMGLGRSVEAVAVASAATAVLCGLVIRSRRTGAQRLIAALTDRVAALVLYLFAGACLSTAANLTGYVDWIAASTVRSDAGIPMIVAVGVMIAPLLLRRLSPLTVALLIVPTFPPALHAAGASQYQTLALCCGIVAAGVAGRAWVDDVEPAGKGPLFLWVCLIVAAVFSCAVLPAIAGFLPTHLRPW